MKKLIVLKCSPEFSLQSIPGKKHVLSCKKQKIMLLKSKKTIDISDNIPYNKNINKCKGKDNVYENTSKITLNKSKSGSSYI